MENKVYCCECKFFKAGDGYAGHDYCRPTNAPMQSSYYREYQAFFYPKEQNRDNRCEYFQQKEKLSFFEKLGNLFYS